MGPLPHRLCWRELVGEAEGEGGPLGFGIQVQGGVTHSVSQQEMLTYIWWSCP